MSTPQPHRPHPLLIPGGIAACLALGGAGSIIGGPLGIALSLLALAPVFAIVWAIRRAAS